MKNFKLILLLTLLVFVACTEFEHGPNVTSSVNPAKVENVILTPINGGFEISYDLPKNNDILYVKAVYINSKGIEAEVKSSVFSNKIQILGFEDMTEKNIKLYAVNRSDMISEPVSISGTPLISPLQLIQQNMAIVADFGGVKYLWINELKVPIAIDLLVKNNLGKMVVVKTQFTSQQGAAQVSLRGYESVPTLFAAVIRDSYSNVSDTVYAATPDKLLTPIFETRLNKKLFKKVVLANDQDWSQWGNDYFDLFDDDLTSTGHTLGGAAFPQILTVDLGVNVKLSRFTVYQRTETGFAYTHGNPKVYDVYGAKVLPGTNGDLSEWTLLKQCVSTKPSGLPGTQKNDEDIARALAGDEYTFEDGTEIRYFRFVVKETWDGATYVDFNELTFWGVLQN
jgi:hypothetical protein